MLREKWYTKPFAQGSLELIDGVLFYYDVPKTARVRQLRLRVVPIKLRRLVLSACHVSPLAGHSHEQRTLFRILARYWWPGVTKDVTEFIRSCAHCKLANSCSHEAQQQLHSLEADAPFDVVFLDFWEPGNIPDSSGSKKVLTCLDCMTGFAAGSACGS